MRDLTPNRAELDPIEIASIDEIRSLQLQRLKWSLRHAYDNVAMYKARFDAAGVHPDDLQELSDLAKFPFTTKGDLRDAYPFGMFAVPREQILRVHASSGTTGKPTVVGYTQKDIDTWADLLARSLRASGLRRGDMVHNAYGYGLFTGGLGAHYGIERLGATVVPMSGGQTEKQVTLIEDFRASTIMITPSYMLSVLDEYRAQGLDPRKSPLEVGIFGAEPWTNAMRCEVEKAFDMHAVDIYGLSEVIGPGVSCETADQDGLVIMEDHFLPEIVDPDSGERLPDGEVGVLVLTSLTKEAFPVLRYWTGDLCSITREPSPCGRTHARMSGIVGRADDMLVIRGVNVYPSQVEHTLLGVEGVSAHFQLVVRREGTLDHLHLRVECIEELDIDDHPELARTVVDRLRSSLGLGVTVGIEPAGSVPRSEGGKLSRTHDLRQL